MLTDRFTGIESFFNEFTRSFVMRAHNAEPYELKIDHTRQVCENLKILVRTLRMNESFNQTALTAGLLHDIGRFPQFEKYATFSDKHSENHAAIGGCIIREHNVLQGLTEKEQQQIMDAVIHHNAFGLPKDMNPQTRKIAALVRDADKLDIYRVMVALYSRKPVKGKTSFITHSLPDDGQIKPGLIADIEARRMVDYNHVTTLNDMKMLQISWVFDLNFQASANLVRQHGFIDKILATMPDSPEKNRISEIVSDYCCRTPE